jgi:hypothetical protein
MPKLLLFVPCERVILGQGDNSVSLIVLIQKLQLNQAQVALLPENSAVFTRISLFTEWQKAPNDSEKIFEQKFTFGIVGAKPVVESVMDFKMSGRTQRTVGVLEAFPVVPAGEYEFSLWLREQGANWPTAPIASWPIEVVHAPNVVIHT